MAVPGVAERDTGGQSSLEEAGRIMVVGSTGTVGSEVLRRLVDVGARPLALIREGHPGLSAIEGDVDRVSADLDRAETVDAALVGVDRLFLLTRQTSRQLAQERGVIAAAARAGVGRVVKLSVFRADERSPLQIARQHAEAERILQESGLQHTVLRPVFFMQNLLAMVRGDAIATAARDGRVAMIDARDVAAAAVAALLGIPAEGRIHTLTGPEPLSFDQVAERVGRRLGRGVRHVRVPVDVVGERFRLAGAEPWFADDMAVLHAMLADGYEDLVTNDVATLTGVPPTPLDRFAEDVHDRFAPAPAPSAGQP
jgi:uncharacterized protein YbjT (DUF2867 family)